MKQPLNNGLIVELIDESETTTGSGIILKNNTAENTLAKGYVRSDSAGVLLGDVVHFPRYKGVRYNEDGKTMVYLKPEDLLMKE